MDNPTITRNPGVGPDRQPDGQKVGATTDESAAAPTPPPPTPVDCVDRNWEFPPT